MRIMAVDYGDARSGIAVSDLTRTLVGEAWTIHERSPGRLIEAVSRAAAERDVSRIIVGNPLNMDGSAGPRSEICGEFAEKLREASGIAVELRDERRTTVDAHRILSEVNRRGKKRKEAVDAVAASLILEGYLNGL